MESLYSWIWPGNTPMSIVIFIVGSMFFLFLARTPIHKALQSLAEGTSGGFKKIAESAEKLAAKMKERDRKVLLESGVAAIERKLQEEFGRVEISYSKNLAEYPGLQRRLDDHISKMEGDYRECGQTVPKAPGWNEAVTAIAKLKGSAGDRVIEKMLAEIHKSAVDGEKRALAELRSTTSQRHKILSGMAPVWKNVNKLLKEIGNTVGQVLETSSRIDKYMNEFQKVSKGNEDSIDMLASRANKMFIFSLLIVAIAGFGAFVNFQLIALPVSELVPSGTRVMGMPVSDFSAMVIICLEIVCGIFLMESLGFTNIIPQIHMMTRNNRRMIMIGSLVFLFLFACTEASLGILREMLAEAKSSVEQALAGSNAAVAGGGSKYTVIGQATLGFLLPWVLAMVAMPLEVFIESSQHAVARIMTLLVMLFGQLFRALAFLIENLIKIIMHLYDAYVIVPLQLFNLATGKHRKEAL